MTTASDLGPPPKPKAAGTAEPSATPEAPPQTAQKREWAWGATVVIAGLIAIVLVFVVAVIQFKTAAEVTTAVSTVSGVIAALVGAYFGIRGSSLAQTNSQTNAAGKTQSHKL
jgi:hypothetical protein